MYIIDDLQTPNNVASSSVDLSSFCLRPSSFEFYLWHSRLGHVSSSRLNYLISSGSLVKVKGHDISDCNGCKLAKFSFLPFTKCGTVTKSSFDLSHSNVWGPSPVTTKGGSRYYVPFIDDNTRYCWLYVMKHRFDILRIYIAFRALVNSQILCCYQMF